MRPQRPLIGAFHLVRTHLGGVGGFKPTIHFHCVLLQKGGGWVQIACKIAYVLNGRSHTKNDAFIRSITSYNIVMALVALKGTNTKHSGYIGQTFSN